MATLIKECDKVKIHITEVAEHGSIENDKSLFFTTKEGFVQLDKEGKEVEEYFFSMSLKGIFTRMTSNKKDVKNWFKRLKLDTGNAPHKYTNGVNALMAVIGGGDEFDAIITRKLVKKGTQPTFMPLVLDKDTYCIESIEVLDVEPFEVEYYRNKITRKISQKTTITIDGNE